MTEELDFSTLSLFDRLNHKSWKARVNAYEEMKSNFSNSANEQDECFRPFLDDPTLYQKIVTDSNVAAQEVGINSLVLFLEYAGPQASIKLRSVVVQPLAEKGLASMRAGTKQASLEAILRFIELDTPDAILENLFPLLSHKIPKLVAATTLAYCEIFKNFGAKVASPKIIIKTIPKLFAHADKNVRAEASALTIELYRWLGDGIKSVILSDLKPVQQKELEEQFSKVVGQTPEQKRLLRHQKEALALADMNRKGIDNDGSGQSLNGGTQSEFEDQVDPLEFVEAVNVLSKIPDDFYPLSRSIKWKERKEALEALYTVVNTPKIQEGDFHELASTLAKCIMKDANVQVVTLAANSLECIARGLKSQFAPYKAIVLGPTLERLKEKKPSIADALNNALDALYLSTSFSDCLDDILEYLTHKTPQVKIGTAHFLIRCLKTVKVTPKKSEIAAINDVCLKLVGDTQEPVRAAGQEALGVVMKIIGPREMTPVLEGLEDLRKNKINEFYEKAEVVAKPENPRIPPPVGNAPGNIASNKRPAVNSLPNSRRAVRPVITTPKKLGPGSILGKSPRQVATRTATRPGMSLNNAPGSTTSSLARPGFRRPAPPGADNSESMRPSPNDNGRLSPVRSKEEQEGLMTPTLGGRPSLMNNRLAQRLATPQIQVPGLSIAEKTELVALRAEVETLRAEKKSSQQVTASLQSQINQNQVDVERLLREIADLQAHKSVLSDEKFKINLTLKGEQAKITRLSGDLDSANQKIATLKNEKEKLNTQLRQLQIDMDNDAKYGSRVASTRTDVSNLSEPSRKDPVPASSSNTFRQTTEFSVLENRLSSVDLNRSNESFKAEKSESGDQIDSIRSESSNRLPKFGLSSGRTGDNYDLNGNSSSFLNYKRAPTTLSNFSAAMGRTSSLSEQNNFRSSSPTPNSTMMPTTSTFTPTSTSNASAGSNSDPLENWKRAAEVTVQLRARIEAMKARRNETN